MTKVEFPSISATLPFGLNGIAGLEQNQYYWCRHPTDGTRFIAKLENNHWWLPGNGFAVNITRDQVICVVKAPEN